MYKEQIQKRGAGELIASPSQVEKFGIVSDWVAAEATPGSADQPSAATFTRVVVSDLKPDILQQFQDEAAKNVCRHLAHLYHYYLHGPDGNVRQGMFPIPCMSACKVSMLPVQMSICMCLMGQWRLNKVSVCSNQGCREF